MGGLDLAVLAAPTREELAARAARLVDDAGARADRAIRLDGIEGDARWRAVAFGPEALRALSAGEEAPGLIRRSGRSRTWSRTL